jgi:hypothetical protein
MMAWAKVAAEKVVRDAELWIYFETLGYIDRLDVGVKKKV